MMSPEVAELVKQERLLEAAELARNEGDHRAASALFERACQWAQAADEAEQAGDVPRAILMSSQAKDEARGLRLLLALTGDRPTLSSLAYQLERTGNPMWAARVYETIGDTLAAAAAWELGGEGGGSVRAAELLERLGDAPKAAKVLETALRRKPDAHEVALALGSLLVRYGKLEAAVRTLQRIPHTAFERRGALACLVKAFDKMNLGQAKREAEDELTSLGASVESIGPASVRGPESVAPPSGQVRKPRFYGRYEVQNEIASSASARVLDCVDIVQHTRVALKIFVSHANIGSGRDALARFEREVKILSSLNHPNIVPLREYVPEGPAIATAWMEGGTLEDLLAKGPVSPRRAVEIARSILLAAAEAHRLSVLHRDIKPGNVLFDAGGTAKLADFGVAHLNDTSSTATAGIIGTLAYMSPEQRKGLPASAQSDIYGVGALLLEMLTFEPPDVHGPPRLLPSAAHRNLSGVHDHLVLSLVAEAPSERPESALNARALLATVEWPDEIERIAPRTSLPPRADDAEPSRDSRFRARLDRGAHSFDDALLGRVVERLELTNELLARLTTFAQLDHPGFELVSRVEEVPSVAWLSPPKGRALERALEPTERRKLAGLLDLLHAAGMVHGFVDREHVYVDDTQGTVSLRFPRSLPNADHTIDQDRLAAARL